MKLFLVHCGFYDPEMMGGVYESHVNFFVAAETFEEARAKAKEYPAYREKHMHVDGLQQIDAIDGFRVTLEEDAGLEGGSLIENSRHRTLAPKSVV